MAQNRMLKNRIFLRQPMALRLQKLLRLGVSVILTAVGLMLALMPARLDAATAMTPGATVARRAWQIVSTIRGTYTRVPGGAPSPALPGGPVLGNGSMGVALQGGPDQPTFYIGRDDFWSILRGRIMPVGRLQLTIPQLKGASYHVDENIGPADLTGRFATSTGSALQFKCFVANPWDVMVLQLHNAGSTPLEITPQLLDGWGTAGAAGMAGQTGRIHWLTVSPETMDARIGEPTGKDPAKPFDGQILDVRIYRGALRPQSRAVFNFLSKTVGNSSAASTRFDCGNLLMPQRAFTVTARVRPTAARGSRAIFSVMCRVDWRGWNEPTPPQIPYGFSLSLVDGKLSALLNRVRVTGLTALPLNAWSRVAATYDGTTLSIRVNGQLVASTHNFPSADEVVGPMWHWTAIHPGDRHIPYDGCGPRGLLAWRVVGAQTPAASDATAFALAPGGAATLVLTAMDDRDAPHLRAESLRLLHGANAGDIEAQWSKHLAWWKKFWGKSYIQIPDKLVQDNYYGALYLLACCSRPGAVPPGLWGNLITSPQMGWQGDYTLDYNYEAPFWAAFPTNHVDLAQNYDGPLLFWMKRGAGLAAHRGFKGIFYYCHLAPAPGWSADGAKSLRQKSDALFASVNCMMRWRYTRDPAYARHVYPFLKAVAAFWDHYLVLKNGIYMDYNDAADELHYPNDVNPATSIAFLRLLYSGLLSMHSQLGLGSDHAARWGHILRHLAPMPIRPAGAVFQVNGHPANQSLAQIIGALAAGKSVIAETQRGTGFANPRLDNGWQETGSSAGMSSVQVIFPGMAIGLESSPSQRAAAFNTVSFSG
ncbi:MAG: LamG domain-containing protein, partial [Phycisphaerales bacterium]|nr:LamG domain-containing protein [Phycisphaerales bacterium]